MWTKIISIASAVTVLGGLVAGGFFLDDRYANADSIRQLNQAIQTTNKRIDFNFLVQRLNYLNSRIDRIVDRCNTTDALRMPEPERSHYRDLLREKKSIEDQLQKMGGK